MKATNLFIRVLAIAAGLFGVFSLLGALYEIAVSFFGDRRGPDWIMFIAFWSSISAYFTYLGYVALVDYSPFVIRHVLGILGLLAFHSLTDVFFIPVPEVSVVPPLLFFGTIALIYWIYRACSRALIGITFPDRERIRSTKAVEPTGTSTAHD